MNHDAQGTFKLLPDESNLIRLKLRNEWFKQQMHMEIITDNLHLEYSRDLQRKCLDSYSAFKACLKDLSCIADTLRKFGIDNKLDVARSAIFMRIYGDVIHTVTGWNEYRSTLLDCLNIVSFTQEQYVQWKDHNIKAWSFDRRSDPDSKITTLHLIDDY